MYLKAATFVVAFFIEIDYKKYLGLGNKMSVHNLKTWNKLANKAYKNQFLTNTSAVILLSNWK